MLVVFRGIEKKGNNIINLNIIMAYHIIYVLMLLCLQTVCSTEAKEFRQHTMQWEHQEMVFSKLINSTPPYNARLRPFATKNVSVKVNTSIFLYSVTAINELRTDYTMQILYRETWYDDRLVFTPDATVQKIFGDNWHAQHIWIPAVHVVNDNDMEVQGNVKMLVHIDSNGKVLLSKRRKLRPFCKMEFYRYPMDKQRCTLEIESSILPSSDLELTWAKEKPLDLIKNFVVAGFILTNYTLEQRIKTYSETGNFSRIIVKFELQREFEHFLLDIYIPSMLFVVTSWLSFWVEIPAAPARVSLGITTMLTLVTSEKVIREKLPKVSYVHALDIWNVVCTGFVFASLVEYALVNYIYHKNNRRRKNKTLKRTESCNTFSSSVSEAGSSPRLMFKKMEHLEPSMPNKKSASISCLAEMQPVNQVDIGWLPDELELTPQDIANGIDRKCRYIFPVGFLVFNIIYWLVLLL